MSVSDPQLRIAQLESELMSANGELITAKGKLNSAERELKWANLRIQMLEEKLRLKRIQILGPHSETLNDLQLALLADEEPGVTSDEVAAEAKREPITREPARERKPHPGREKLPEHLRREEKIIPCAEQTCSHCGKEMAVIGYDISEQLDMEPAVYFVRQIKREKRACRCCEQGTVKTAPLPDRIVEKGLASDAVVIDTVVSKYCDHQPLYRQAVIMEREAGLEIGRATLDGWVMRVGELLIPVTQAMRLDLLKSTYLQADETTVPVQMHDGRGSNYEAYLWQYGQPGGETVFEFRMGRGREGPIQFLGRWEGILQTDGYQAYDGVGGEKLVHVGCWAHARRKFVDAVKVNKDDAAAASMVMRMDALFLVDRDARQKEMSAGERLVHRRELSQPFIDEIQENCRALLPQTLPQSALGKAVRYTLNQWSKLVRCLEYEEVELSNNLAENSMRGVALGRKNWLHVGSVKAGPKVAAILSVVESCRRIGAPVREYLADVLPGMDRRTRSQVAGLTPARWNAARG